MPNPMPTLDDLISLAVKLDADGKDTDAVFEQIMDDYPDETEDGTVDAKFAQAQFHYRLFATRLD